jgi:hypothetical protein
VENARIDQEEQIASRKSSRTYIINENKATKYEVLTAREGGPRWRPKPRRMKRRFADL